MVSSGPFLRARGISKAFPGVQALESVDFEICQGEVVGLVGENGAGKSTLIKVFAGAYQKDAGELQLRGEIFEPNSPLDARQAGISVIHQELSLCPDMTVAENLFLGREITHRASFVPDTLRPVARSKEIASARCWLEEVDLDLSPDTMVRELTTSVRQTVEIARAISMDATLIIMDEPTSGLTRQEARTLFKIIRRLKSSGKAVLFITHRLEEIFEIADRIVVLRDGQRVGELSITDATKSKVVSMMVGREIANLFPKEQARIGEVMLEAQNLRRGKMVRDVSFSVRCGEVLGVTGLIGAGRTETMRLVFGADRRDAGEILVEGQPVDIRTPVDGVRAGIAMVPEDRRLQGLILLETVVFNIVLPQFRRLANGLIASSKREEELAESYIERLSIRTPSLFQKVRFLSGGNQQKVILARWLAAHCKVMILDEPTRGIDVGAKAEIHRLISDMAKRGVAIVLVSSELPEIIAMSDRILVMAEGEVTGQLTRAEADQEKIMGLAVPVRRRRDAGIENKSDRETIAARRTTYNGDSKGC
ncbi:MAG: ATP-binding cassette domain-containing protein [Anaerolineae bacterium]|nr:ATP-binding cassette domain-containing protein [Anaerolineae bacterium]NIQ80306.1 ATP-binding cassette domain-containing protein [Anaerolineae bacterium]